MTKITFQIGQNDAAIFYGFNREHIPDLQDIVEFQLFDQGSNDNIIRVEVESL